MHSKLSVYLQYMQSSGRYSFKHLNLKLSLVSGHCWRRIIQAAPVFFCSLFHTTNSFATVNLYTFSLISLNPLSANKTAGIRSWFFVWFEVLQIVSKTWFGQARNWITWFQENSICIGLLNFHHGKNIGLDGIEYSSITIAIELNHFNKLLRCNW